MIKVSVIVPVYNASAYLRECMNSIIQQTMKELEIICINDGSADDSIDILKEYAAKDARIIVIDQENMGYGCAMNRGIQTASGEYIGIVEPDDSVSLDMYKSLYEIAIKLDLDIAKADFYQICGKGESEKKEYIPLTRHKVYYGKVLAPRKHPQMFLFRMNTWTGIYKRKFIVSNDIRHQETPGASYQDNGFWFQTFSLAKRVCLVPEAFYKYRTDNPASSVYSRAQVYRICEEYAYIYNFLNLNLKLKKQLIDVFQLVKYHNYQFTLMRIDPLYQGEFLMRFSQEFHEALAKGELSSAYFSKNDWFFLKRMMKSPKRYEKKFLRKGILCYKIGYYLNYYGLRKTLKKIAEACCYDKSIRHRSGL